MVELEAPKNNSARHHVDYSTHYGETARHILKYWYSCWYTRPRTTNERTLGGFGHIVSPSYRLAASLPHYLIPGRVHWRTQRVPWRYSIRQLAICKGHRQVRRPVCWCPLDVGELDGRVRRGTGPLRGPLVPAPCWLVRVLEPEVKGRVEARALLPTRARPGGRTI